MSSVGNTEFSLKEAAALSGLPEKAVRHEIDRRVMVPTTRPAGSRRRLRLGSGQVCYLRLIARLPFTPSREDRAAFYRIVAEGEMRAGRWSRHGRRLMAGEDAALLIDVGEVSSDARRRIDLYRRGMAKVESDPSRLGGEPVFAGTRLPLRHIGTLALRGVTVGDILADHPALRAEDVEFARLYAAMKPGPGRPRARLKFRRA